MENTKIVVLDGENLSVEDIVSIGRGEKKVTLNEDSLKKCRASREYLQTQVDEGKVIYGVNTSFGSMCNKIIHDDAIDQLQENLVRSHAAGLGEPIKHTIALGAVVVRLNALVKGYSGVRIELLEFLKDTINNQIAPYIPTRGSVGASGDLVHLAHLALTLIGEGQAYYKGELMQASEAYKKAGMTAFKLKFKEGIAIINGTSVMTAIAAFAVHLAKLSLKVECVAASFAMEVFHSIDDFLHPSLHDLKPHRGQIEIARILRELLEGSENITDRDDLHEVIRDQNADKQPVFETSIYIQNVYSIRCTPQILAPVYEAIENAQQVVETEANSTNDNPIVIPEENKVLHGGNFHGQSIGFYMDCMAIALSTMSNIAERRLNTLVDSNLNGELPEYLISTIKGLDMGFMGAQYLATSTTAENRQLANPVSTNTISSNSANQDVVSMGTIAARKVYTSATNLSFILTLQILADLQALSFKDTSKLGKGTQKAYQKLVKDFKVYDSTTVFHDMLNLFKDKLFKDEIFDDLDLFDH